jgi:hypothetical protein
MVDLQLYSVEVKQDIQQALPQELVAAVEHLEA